MLRRMIAIALIALVSLSGCGLFDRDEKRERLQRVLDDDAHFAVFLDEKVTAPQKADIEARLRAIPGNTGVAFVSKEEAFKTFTEKLDPQAEIPIEAENMPETYTVKMKDQDGVRAVRDTAVKAELEAVPGVSELVFSCTTIEECEDLVRRNNSPKPSAS